MANVKPEALKPYSADGMYVKSQRNPHSFEIEQHRTSISTCRRQGERTIEDDDLEP